jgi:two-component system, NtrC family, nitrogen regulation sensor histidine kinase NtrY
MDRALEVETTAILDEVGSLSRLVDEFSRFARLPAPQCAPCDLGAIVDQAVAHHRPRIDAARVEVAISRGAGAHRVSADADQIGRALKNILANALDAIEGAGAGGARAPRAGRIDIALTAVEAAPAAGGASGRFEEIVVRDHGPGLAPEALRMLFEPYFTTRGERGGTGLGLAIVHRIVTEHGGRVTARNAQGGGAEIVMRLPADGPPAAGGAAPGGAPAGGRA